MSRTAPTLTTILVFAIGTPTRAPAEQLDIAIDGTRCRVFAPDWTWLGEAISILVVAEAPSDGRGATDLRLELTLPPGVFASDDPEPIDVPLGPEGPTRRAFRGLVPRVDGPLGEHALELAIMSSSGIVERRTLLVKTVRGTAVPGGSLSVLIPSGIALVLAVPLFAIHLARHGGGKWWSRVASPAADARQETGWWTEN